VTGDLVQLIEVTVDVGKENGGWELRDSAYAEDADAAIVAARTLWDESFTGLQGCRRRLSFYMPNGDLRRTEQRP
jgi:hypothetical protein